MNAMAQPAVPDQASRLRAMVEAMRADPQPATAPAAVASKRAPARRAPVIAITSGKGGVGKTTLAVNTAIALAARSLRVTLVDADLGMANADVMCGLNPARRLDRLFADPNRAVDSLSTEAPGGFRLIAGATGLAHVAGLDHARYEALLANLRQLVAANDVVLIDTGAGVGPGVTAFCEGADITIVVVTPEPTSIADAYGMIKCLTRGREATGRPPVLLVNQAASQDEARAVHTRIVAVAERFLGIRPALWGWIPADAATSRCIRKRVPLMLEAPKSRAAAGVSYFAGSLADRLGLDRRAAGGVPRILRAVSRIVSRRNGAGFAVSEAGSV